MLKFLLRNNPQNSFLSLKSFYSTNMEKCLVGVCQMRSTNDKQHNRHQVEELVKQGKEKNAKFLFFPECCDYVGENREETLAMSEPLTGDTVQFYQNLARDNQMWLSFGGIHEADFDEFGKKTNFVRNSHIVINDSGSLMATYRKLHLFNVDTPEMKYRESRIVKAGDEIIPPLDSPIGKLGLQICYDIRFGEVSTILRKLGAEVLTYPSAFSYSTGKAHWEILNRSRAIENQAFVISAAQIGDHNKKRKSWGHAMIVGPWGEILAECSNELEVQVVEIDLKAIEKVKNNMPCFEHRRDDAYRLEAIKKAAPQNHCDYYLFHTNKIFRETIFYETELCYAFTNIRCVVPGHVLVATKRVIPRLCDMTLEETKDFFVTVCKVKKVVESYHNAKSATVTVQDGPHSGQTVKHLHCHVMPRKPGDFENNDEIYVELNKHDAPDVQTRRRSVEDMADEAAVYRNLMTQ